MFANNEIVDLFSVARELDRRRFDQKFDKGFDAQQNNHTIRFIAQQDWRVGGQKNSQIFAAIAHFDPPESFRQLD